MNKIDDALDTFNNGFNCAQAVLSAFAPNLGLSRDTALKITSGLGAGLGYQGKICGAVVGAYLVIGLKNGSYMPNDELNKEITYKLTRIFDSEFMDIHHSLICKELLDADLSTPDGFSYALNHGLFDTCCPDFVKSSVMILEKIL
jgi:C_GCAxxG_C_C family probable redox protein